MVGRSAEIAALLRELAGEWSPGKLRALRPELFLRPETFEDDVASRLARIRELLGPDQYGEKICGLLRGDIPVWELEKAATAPEALVALRAELRERYLATTETRMRELVGPDSLGIAIDERSKFVQQWLHDNKVGSLDIEQAAAVGAVHDNVLVTARAGSGKTRTLTARAAFLVYHCDVAPNELLLLVFNRAAADEMKQRLADLGCDVPHVMTFHALAYAIVHPEDALIYDSPKESQPAQSQVFQEVLNDCLDDDKFGPDIRFIMMGHFRADWDRLYRAGLDLSSEEGLQFRRALPSETLRGDYVKSFGEKAIANFLFEHGIPYQYERNHWWGGRNYRPDFTVQVGANIVIEYFGLAGDPDYDKEMVAKREYWRNKADWRLIEVLPQDIAGGEKALGALLVTRLESLGLRCRRRTDDEIWKEIRKRVITRFAEMASTFVGRCRRAAIHPDALEARLESHVVLSEIEGRFLSVAKHIYGAYLARLRAEEKEDFDGLLERAAARVESGHLSFQRKSGRGDLSQIRFIMVDEFQDFSPLFNRLLQAIRKRNPSVQVFCVGDDWQAINAFAGATVEYFERFTEYFEPADRLMTGTNYRSARCVVDAGNRIMAGHGAEADAAQREQGDIIIAELARFEPTVKEKEEGAGILITPVVRRILAHCLAGGGTVVLLARRNRIPYYVGKGPDSATLQECLRRWTRGLSEDERRRVRTSTVHSYKGLQADTVVLLDALPRSWPLIHPDWVFFRILGDSVEKLLEDERRLFYVAVTRAVRSFFLVTHGEETPFVEALQGLARPINWQEFPCSSDGHSDVVVQIGSQPGLESRPTMSVKEYLKSEGFRFCKGTWVYWGKSFRRPEAGVDALRAELEMRPWSTAGEGLEVRVCNDADVVLAKYYVSGGVWEARPLF